jgi:hypothetical protein
MDVTNNAVGAAFLSSINVESVVNREGDALPYAYYNPETSGKLTWMCGCDKEGKITSVFCFEKEDGSKDKKCAYLKDLAEAKYYRDQLSENGWKKLIPPKVELSMSGVDGSQKPLNRKQKRQLERFLKKNEN